MVSRAAVLHTHAPDSYPPPFASQPLLHPYLQEDGGELYAGVRPNQRPQPLPILIYRKMAPSSKTATTPVTPATAEPTVCSLYACETVMPENWLTTQK